jgi:hypothetical protein
LELEAVGVVESGKLMIDAKEDSGFRGCSEEERDNKPAINLLAGNKEYLYDNRN